MSVLMGFSSDLSDVGARKRERDGLIAALLPDRMIMAKDSSGESMLDGYMSEVDKRAGKS